MDKAAPAQRQPVIDRLVRWGGIVALLGSLIFIVDRLWRLDWSMLQLHISGGLIGGIVVGSFLFAVADQSLARAWTAMADPEEVLPPAELRRIYARGVLMKYLPGSIFQYVSRQTEGARKGMTHKRLAQSALIEICFHIVASVAVAAAFLIATLSPFLAVIGAGSFALAAIALRRPLATALGFQAVAFGLFGLAAACIGAAVLPEGIALAHFAALFLLAWLAGFVVPVAPGGIGVREAALLALGNSLPVEGLLAATLVLRIASIIGDVLFACASLGRPRQ